MRDMTLDWKRWNRAERVAALAIPVALIVFVATFAPVLAG
jgi:hypothetical protein